VWELLWALIAVAVLSRTAARRAVPAFS